MTQLIGYNWRNMSKTISLFDIIPVDFNIVKKVLTSFSNLHYCDGILYDLTNSRVHELRGVSFPMFFNTKDSKDIITLAGTIAEESSVIFLLHNQYYDYLRNRKKKKKVYSNLFDYMADTLGTEQKVRDFINLVRPIT